MQGIEDTSILEDVAEAEEEYDRPEQAFNEAGVAFEPFHLKREREEGYFDSDGNYIQYKLDEVKDAWLDSLADGTSTTGSAATTASDQAGKQSAAPAQVLELDADELLTYKRRLLDFLQPQETVLAALRRLGGLQGTMHAGSDALPWKRSRKAAGSSSTSRGAPPGPGPGQASPPARIGRTVPIENREAFDRLTEYSSLLLQHGDYNIHSTPREKLVAQTDAAEAAQLQAVMGVLSTSCTSTASDTSAQTSDLETHSATFSGSAPMFASRAASHKPGAMPGRNEQEASDSMDVDFAVPSAAELAASSATEAAADAAEHAVPADPDEDIFGGAEPQQQQFPDVHGSPKQAGNQESGEAAALSVAADQVGQADTDMGLHKSGTVSSASTSALPSSQSINSGFVYDDSSGTWYNAELGYFYDATQGLYGDASSGTWYSYVDGKYQLVS
ncbi:hypothetical protein ABBQ32_000442 [Trebouxia sp. C0010 RCD-2024]